MTLVLGHCSIAGLALALLLFSNVGFFGHNIKRLIMQFMVVSCERPTPRFHQDALTFCFHTEYFAFVIIKTILH
jgi:hypothetical protein